MYDVIVVGARCAGSPTAMLLARKGYRVLLVDRATFPSDLAMSTHFVHQPGVARLKRWGLLEQVIASNCPPTTTCHWDFGPFALDGAPVPFDGVAEAYAPRRSVLDNVLVNAAVQAGAELREGFPVDELVTEGERVTGIRGRTSAGTATLEHARVVIGADGMHSQVARWVGAPEYNAKPALAAPYFTYWSGVRLNGFEFYPRAYRGAFGFMTNDDLALVATYWAIKDVPAVRADIEGNYFKVLAEVAPNLAERVRGGHARAAFRGRANRQLLPPATWAGMGASGRRRLQEGPLHSRRDHRRLPRRRAAGQGHRHWLLRASTARGRAG
jgi:flavin-dependent dehydrogenase